MGFVETKKRAVFSEHLVEEHGASDDESGWAGTELANHVPNQKEAGPVYIHFQDSVFGKKSRGDYELTKARGGSNLIKTDAMCMKKWLGQLQELE